MFKISVLYPDEPNARFDHAYYKDKHMPLVQSSLGDGCAYYTVDKGLSGGEPGTPSAFVGACHIYTESIERFQVGMNRHGANILADIPNFTDIAPIIQISEVVVGFLDGAAQYHRSQAIH